MPRPRKTVLENSIKNREAQARWRRNNPIAYRLATLKTQASRKGMPFNLTEQHLYSALDRFGWTCQVTGEALTQELDITFALVNEERGYVPRNIKPVRCYMQGGRGRPRSEAWFAGM